MNKSIFEIISENLLIIFYSVLILPFSILFLFNHPSSDDWGPAVNNNIYGFWQTQMNAYKYWTGKYFSSAVLSFSPLYFNSFTGYKVFTLFLMLLFIYVLFVFISEFTKSILNIKERIVISLSVFFLYLYSMPNIAQSFYWLTASVVYQCGIILIMLFLILYNRINQSERSSSGFLLIIISCLVLTAIAGCSEMAMVIGVLTIALFILYNLFIDKKIKLLLVLFAAVISIAAYFLISSPGNSIRGALYPNSHQLLLSLQITITTLIEYLLSWIFLSPLLFVTFLIIPYLFKFAKSLNIKRTDIYLNPLVTGLVFIIILFILFFTPVWSLGVQPFNRTVNIIYFIFLTGWFYNVFVIVYYLISKFNIDADRIPKYAYTAALIIVVLFLFKKIM
ncbi:MAG: hypothetical protein IPL53_24620 [Ignavibacteria bacterium]|nr:hypothetical protein [Ignavibacteria bacterium]